MMAKRIESRRAFLQRMWAATTAFASVMADALFALFIIIACFGAVGFLSSVVTLVKSYF